MDAGQDRQCFREELRFFDEVAGEADKIRREIIDGFDHGFQIHTIALVVQIGKMDEAVGDYLVQLDAAVFVIDCLPNMGPAEVMAKCEPLVKQLRAAKPNTPIVLVEDRRFTNDWITPQKRQFHTDNHAALRAAYQSLTEQGVKKLYYIPGDSLYGDDSEGATDASHASDLGFMRQATLFEPVILEALRN